MANQKDERLDEDNDTPFSEPKVQASKVAIDDPRLDTDIDLDELYHEGRAAAANVDLPDRTGVQSFSPRKKKLKVKVRAKHSD